MCLQWKQHLAELEEELKIEPTIKYVLYEVMQIAADIMYLTLVEELLTFKS